MRTTPRRNGILVTAIGVAAVAAAAVVLWCLRVSVLSDAARIAWTPGTQPRVVVCPGADPYRDAAEVKKQPTPVLSIVSVSGGAAGASVRLRIDSPEAWAGSRLTTMINEMRDDRAGGYFTFAGMSGGRPIDCTRSLKHFGYHDRSGAMVHYAPGGSELVTLPDGRVVTEGVAHLTWARIPACETYTFALREELATDPKYGYAHRVTGLGIDLAPFDGAVSRGRSK